MRNNHQVGNKPSSPSTTRFLLPNVTQSHNIHFPYLFLVLVFLSWNKWQTPAEIELLVPFALSWTWWLKNAWSHYFCRGPFSSAILPCVRNYSMPRLLIYLVCGGLGLGCLEAEPRVGCFKKCFPEGVLPGKTSAGVSREAGKSRGSSQAEVGFWWAPASGWPLGSLE